MVDIPNSYENLSDPELINLYYRLRDEQKTTSDGTCYPNIKLLCATPFEREKDRREQQEWLQAGRCESDVTEWYIMAKDNPCVWWLDNHVIAKHSITSCMSCGACTALCPAAEFYDFNPRAIMALVQEKEEEAIVELLKSDSIWYCHQCGSCRTKCPRRNSPFGMITSLRQLSQLKGYHVESVRGRQQYFGRHLWGGNLWNRAFSLYFRNPVPERHMDFGPRFAAYFKNQEECMKRFGAHPDMEGPFSGRKINPEALQELRKLWAKGGALTLWSLIEKAAVRQALEMGLTMEQYLEKVITEG